MNEDDLAKLRIQPDSELLQQASNAGLSGFAARYVLEGRQLLAVQQSAERSAASSRMAAWAAAVAAVVSALAQAFGATP